MRFEFYGLTFETPKVVFHLWSPWRATSLEHRLFDAMRQLPRAQAEDGPDERRVAVADPKTCRSALQAISRVLKGWQEEADTGSERRTWRWLIEGDTDDAGYDHNGEQASVWAFLRLGLERGGLGESEKAEDVDLDGIGLEITGEAPRFS
ncbi:MAG: hypothetical protein U0797_07555 [Gemmataceae bacterium]